MLPIVRVDDATIGDGRPGPMFRRLLEIWNNEVGLDIEAQAIEFAKRESK